MTLIEVESQTRTFAESHRTLSELVSDLNRQLESVKRKHLPDIRRAVAAAAAERSRLHALIGAAPELFDRPRTYVFHGVKVGLQKQRGGIKWDDEQEVLRLIHRHYGAEASLLLHSKEAPDKTALEKLPAAELRKLGCEIVADADAIVIKPASGEADRVVAALLKEAGDGATAAAA